jgi:hypothetical protein
MNDLTRREALAGVAGAGALALAGCVSSDDTEAADNPSDDADAESTDEPTLSASVERTGSDCSNPEPGRATVFFDEEFVVSGSIPASDPCHVPELTAHSLADGTLSLTVDVTPDSGESCPDCTGIVHYEATVSGPTLDDVDRMSVSHADGETYETPASEIRAGPPAVQGATLTETTGRTRGSGDQSRADIMPPESNGDTGTVTIEGAIPTNHPHHEAVLEEATIRGDTLRVAVGVQSTLDDDRAGTMPLGIVEYTAEVTVEYPDGLRSVTLAHPNSGYGSSWASDSASASAEQ